MPLRVLVWDENPPHAPKELYPHSINGAIAEGLKELDTAGLLHVKTANLDDADQGISDEVLASTDVLFWWGHIRHGQVEDDVAERIAVRVRKNGLGFICLHSGHYSKPFKKVTEGRGELKGGWRESTDSETIRVCAPWHPIAQGIHDFVLPNEEMYGSPFDVPPYETLILQSHFSVGGETFPSGICWTFGDGIDLTFGSGPGGGVGQGHGVGRVFYFRPGHETYPTYFDKNVRRVLYNAALWVGKST
jgi:trehalose utilization protein